MRKIARTARAQLDKSGPYQSIGAKCGIPAALRGQPFDRDSSRGPGNGPGPLSGLLSHVIIFEGFVAVAAIRARPDVRAARLRTARRRQRSS